MGIADQFKGKAEEVQKKAKEKMNEGSDRSKDEAKEQTSRDTQREQSGTRESMDDERGKGHHGRHDDA